MRDRMILGFAKDYDKTKKFLIDYIKENDPRQFETNLRTEVLMRLFSRFIPGFSFLFKREMKKVLEEKYGPARSGGGGAGTV